MARKAKKPKPVRLAIRRARVEPFMQIYAGDWIEPVRKGFVQACCSCALVHVTDYRIDEGKVQFKTRVDRRLTAAARRAKRKGKF